MIFILFQQKKYTDLEHKKLLEDEQLKIISDCSNKLVSLSLRNEKEERERRDAVNHESQKGKESRDALSSSAQEKQTIADKKVNIFCKIFLFLLKSFFFRESLILQKIIRRTNICVV